MANDKLPVLFDTDIGSDIDDAIDVKADAFFKHYFDVLDATA